MSHRRFLIKLKIFLEHIRKKSKIFKNLCVLKYAQSFNLLSNVTNVLKFFCDLCVILIKVLFQDESTSKDFP